MILRRMCRAIGLDYPRAMLPFAYVTEDGFRTEMAAQPDGGLLVTVTAPGGRIWAGQRPTIEDAIQLARQIRVDQASAAESTGRPATPESTAPVQGTL
jgi:hypothetical protein